MSKRQDTTNIAEQILAEARMPHRGKVCRKSLIELVAFLNLRKALNCQHMGVSKSTFEQMPVYRLGNSIIVCRSWHWGESLNGQNLYGPTHSPGQWWEMSGPGFYPPCGNGILSLLMHMQTREFMLRCGERGATDLQEAAVRHAFPLTESACLANLMERLGPDGTLGHRPHFPDANAALRPERLPSSAFRVPLQS